MLDECIMCTKVGTKERHEKIAPTLALQEV